MVVGWYPFSVRTSSAAFIMACFFPSVLSSASIAMRSPPLQAVRQLEEAFKVPGYGTSQLEQCDFIIKPGRDSVDHCLPQVERGAVHPNRWAQSQCRPLLFSFKVHVSDAGPLRRQEDRKSTRLNSSHVKISYA